MHGGWYETKHSTGVLVLTLATLCGADEIWCLSRTTDTVKRFDARSGELLGYVVSTNPLHSALIDPGVFSELIDIKRDEKRRIYLLNHKTGQSQTEGQVARYDRDGGNAVVPLANDPQGDWYRKYSYATDALALHGTNLYIGSRMWSTKPESITVDLRGKRLMFEHNLSDGAAAGRLVGALSGSDDYRTGGMWMHATNAATALPNAIYGMAFNSQGHLIVGCNIGHNYGGLFRFDDNGEWYGPGGVGDAQSFITNAIKDIQGLLLDSSDRIYVCGEGGGAVMSGVKRYNSDGSAAPAPGKSGAFFCGWVGYQDATPVYPTAMTLNPAEAILYLYSPGVSVTYGTVNPGLKMYAVGGDNEGDYLGMLVSGTDAAADVMLYVETPSGGTCVLIR